MALSQNRTTRSLILTMCALVCVAVAIAYLYYKNINESVDPRIVEARTLYEKYNLYAQNSAFDSIFSLMDEIEAMYTAHDHYQDSYEIGVLYNNRAASYITIALFSEGVSENPGKQDSLINMAELACNRSIEIYQNWLVKFGGKSRVEVETLIANDFFQGLLAYDQEEVDRFFESRIDEVVEAQAETKRRLSVSYTNQGIIYRYKLQYEAAAESYKMAIELWDRNLTAENNLNILLDRPIRKRNFIQKMFPPKKD